VSDRGETRKRQGCNAAIDKDGSVADAKGVKTRIEENAKRGAGDQSSTAVHRT
jgi:hypothetical protein